MKAKIWALLVMARERRLPLLEQLEASGIEVLAACDCREACRILRTNRSVEVVLTDTKLPDGDWRSVLETVTQGPRHAEVVVCTRWSDNSLWREVVERGAYDLLTAPYRAEEVLRVVEGAAATSYMRSLPAARALSRAAVA